MNPPPLAIMTLENGIRRSSLRWKLQILIVTPMTLAVVVFLALATAYQSHRLEAGHVENVRSVVQALAQDFARVDLLSGQSDRSDLASRLRSFPDIEHLFAFDSQGRSYYYYGGSGLRPITPPPVRPPPSVELAGDKLHVFEAVTYQGTDVGTVYVRSNASAIVHQLRHDLILLGLAGLGFASFTFFVSRLLRRVVTSPVESLSTLVRDVTNAGNYTLRSPIRRGDELGQLARGVNDLLKRVELSTSESHKSREGLETLVEELETKNAELERFTYTVSHDLKGPLVTIRGFAGILEKDLLAQDHGRIRQDLDQINNAAEKMHHLLGDLLELSRIGRVIHPQEEISVGELVDEVKALLAENIRQRGVDVTVHGGETKVFADRVRMLEVFQNLIENAVKFMGSQCAPRIVVEATAEDGETLCRVRDNGMGIDPRHQEKIFGLFNKLEATAEGTGVGLALVKRIVEVHGGSVRVESEGPRRGSTFVFTLPHSGMPSASGDVTPES